MTRSLTILAASVALAFGVVALVVSPAEAASTALLLLALGSGALVIAHLAARHRDRVGALQRQFIFTLLIMGIPMLVLVAAFAELMFVSNHDALLVMITIAFGAGIAARAAQLLAAGVLADVRAVRDGLSAVGEGQRELRIETAGSDEIEQLAVATEAMVKRLASAELAQRHLIAGVSHDLRTPLTSLQLLAEAAGDDVIDDPGSGRYLATMRTHIAALGALVDDLFELSRLQAGDIEWSMERVRLDDLVTETVEAMGVQARAEGVSLVAEVPTSLSAERANPERVQRVLFNLIQNAIRHTPADGSITVRAEPTSEGVEIEVADTGPGVAAHERDRVFDPAFRGGTDASRASDGAGLGLAISRAIVEAHGGRIWLPDATRGTRVRFTLPHRSADELAV